MRIYGVVHVCARDGYSENIVGHATTVKKTILSYAMRYIGKTPFYYLIHRETRDHWGSTGRGKDAELNKRLL